MVDKGAVGARPVPTSRNNNKGSVGTSNRNRNTPHAKTYGQTVLLALLFCLIDVLYMVWEVRLCWTFEKSLQVSNTPRECEPNESLRTIMGKGREGGGQKVWGLKREDER